MARPKKPLSQQNSHLTKDEIADRELQEELIKVDSDKISCPSWVKGSIARKQFDFIAAELRRLGVITNLDINPLAQYCVAYANYVQATKELKSQSLLIKYTNKNGSTNLIENPLIKIQLKYSDEMKKWANVLGLTIDSRLKFAISKTQEVKDEIVDEFGDI